MPEANAILVSGADQSYFDLLNELLQSLERSGALARYPLGILDLGLTDEQCALVRRYTERIVRPGWNLKVPHLQRREGDLGRIARPFLPRHFAGFSHYVWIDADIWVQDSQFIEDYLAAARKSGFAIVKERERAYRLQPWLLAWTVKNFVAMYGLHRGLYLCCCEPINNGVFALAADAPHWDSWAKYYQEGLNRSGKLYSQFSMAAAIHLDRLPVTYMPGTHNWICDRGLPMWDPERKLFCAPYPGGAPISVMHLAGPAKKGRYRIATTDGRSVVTSFRFGAASLAVPM